jgi:hypothetical protein
LQPYAQSVMEPDQCIAFSGLPMPTIVVECGWAQSRPSLHRARDLWLVGGQGTVQLVIIIKFAKRKSNKTVKADLEVFELVQGIPQLLQREVKSYMLIIDTLTDLRS